MLNKQKIDLIKTIGDDEDVEDLSEDSDIETEFQPSKQKNKRKADFDTDFQFVSSVDEYNKDSWNDLNKYIKRKVTAKTDERIKRFKAQLNSKEHNDGDGDDADNDVDNDTKFEQDVDSDLSISDDELKYDNIKIKETKKKNKNKQKAKEEENANFFDNNIDVTTNIENTSFYQMNLSRPLLKAITEMKFVHPTPIQSATIPIALLGKDVCGCAATGTGKTAAYMLPTLERLLYRPSGGGGGGGTSTIRVLVLVPTRELGVQVYQVSKQLCQFTDIQIGLAVGGLDLKAQESILRRNPDIVIATPGRLIDHLKNTPTFTLDSIEILILDEADRMLDEYFAEQMKEIIKQCSRTRQTMLFSATMTDEVENLAAVSLKKPAKLFVNNNQQVAFNLRQEFLRIRSDKETDREPILAALVCRTFRQNCIIFVQTKKQAHRLHILLGLLGVKCGELHGNLTQPQRLDALQRFKDKQIDVLVATDVAARGLDIVGVQTVVNFVMPATIEHYIHRVGRTARAGRAGVSVSLAGEQERKIVKMIIKRAKNPVKSRIIPTDILDKYRTKLQKLEPQITQILQEEYEERLMNRAENQANRTEKLLKGELEEKRPWFQTKKQRKDEKERLTLGVETKQAKNKNKTKKEGGSTNNNNNNNKKKMKNITETSEDRINNELNKTMLLQARLAKRKHKSKKINTIGEENTEKQTKRGRYGGKKTNFNDDLWNTSKKNTKKLRYEANSFKKMKNNKKGNKRGTGKTYGRPQQKKQRQ